MIIHLGMQNHQIRMFTLPPSFINFSFIEKEGGQRMKIEKKVPPIHHYKFPHKKNIYVPIKQIWFFNYPRIWLNKFDFKLSKDLISPFAGFLNLDLCFCAP